MYPDECDSTKATVEYPGEVWEGEAKFVKQLEAVHTIAAKKIPRCSSTTNSTVLRAALGTHPLKTHKRHEKAEMAIQSKAHVKIRRCQP